MIDIVIFHPGVDQQFVVVARIVSTFQHGREAG